MYFCQRPYSVLPAAGNATVGALSDGIFMIFVGRGRCMDEFVRTYVHLKEAQREAGNSTIIKL